jgi:hypothetical protein
MSDEAPKKVLVVAVKDGHDGEAYRYAGSQFYVDSKRITDGSDWFVEPERAPEIADTTPRRVKG